MTSIMHSSDGADSDLLSVPQAACMTLFRHPCTVLENENEHEQKILMDSDYPKNAIVSSTTAVPTVVGYELSLSPQTVQLLAMRHSTSPITVAQQIAFQMQKVHKRFAYPVSYHQGRHYYYHHHHQDRHHNYLEMRDYAACNRKHHLRIVRREGSRSGRWTFGRPHSTRTWTR